MRPAILNPLFAGVAGIKGIGQKLDKTLAAFLRPSQSGASDAARIVDLLFHLGPDAADYIWGGRAPGTPGASR